MLVFVCYIKIIWLSVEKEVKSSLGFLKKRSQEWKWGSILELVNMFEKVDPSKMKVKVLRILKIHLAM